MILQPWYLLVMALANWLNRQQQAMIEYLREENRVLREKLGKKRILLNDDQRRRLAIRGKVLGRKLLSGIACLFTPETILAWHSKLIAHKYDGSRRRGPGRPETEPNIRELVLQMASDNLSWGYTRIQGALANLGHNIGRTTIRRILQQAGLEPAPERHKGMSWKQFLKIHWDTLAAADFFTVEVWTLGGLVRYLVLFVIDLSTRKVEIAGIAPDPDGHWMKQVARNLTDPFAGFLRNKKYLIHDRDPLFTEVFAQMLKVADVKTVKLPPQSPNLNALAERFVRSIKSECLERMIFFGEASLHRAVVQFLEHYHRERNHQGLANRLIQPEQGVGQAGGTIQCRNRLGGLLRYYHRAA
jgi:transposase InsO family protein